jgi:hypothetical protein
MSPDFLLYPAIFIFSMLVIGLVYTVKEFTKMGEKSDEKLRQKELKEAKDK